MAFALHSQLATAEKSASKISQKTRICKSSKELPPNVGRSHTGIYRHNGTKYPHDAKKTLLCACGQHIATPYTAA